MFPEPVSNELHQRQTYCVLVAMGGEGKDFTFHFTHFLFAFYENHCSRNKNWRNSEVPNRLPTRCTGKLEPLPGGCSWRPLSAKEPAKHYLWLLESQRAEQNLKTRVKRECGLSPDNWFCRAEPSRSTPGANTHHCRANTVRADADSGTQPLRPARWAWETATPK